MSATTLGRNIASLCRPPMELDMSDYWDPNDPEYITFVKRFSPAFCEFMKFLQLLDHVEDGRPRVRQLGDLAAVQTAEDVECVLETVCLCD